MLRWVISREWTVTGVSIRIEQAVHVKTKTRLLTEVATDSADQLLLQMSSISK
jgi:hypothetical protein